MAATIGGQEAGHHHPQAAEIEARLREKAQRHEKVSKNVAAIHDERLTFGQRVSDRLAKVAGSWTFIFAFALTLGTWVLLNTVALVHHWDKYPYILLNLFLSMLAAIQAPVIMMSQNRTETRDRLRARARLRGQSEGGDRDRAAAPEARRTAGEAVGGAYRDSEPADRSARVGAGAAAREDRLRHCGSDEHAQPACEGVRSMFGISAR